MVYVYFDDIIRYNTYRDRNAGYTDIQLCNSNHVLICLELSVKDKTVFLVKSDSKYDGLYIK